MSDSYVEKYLAVDSDVEFANSESAVWIEQRRIGMVRVDNMTQGIQELMRADYLYVGINGDIVDYMPLLSTMRAITNTLIFIGTNNFTTKKEVDALDNGADLYDAYKGATEDNIASVLAHISHLTRITKREEPPRKALVYRDLLVAPHQFQRGVYLGNRNLDLTPIEFSVLKHLMSNSGKVLTYKEIYEKVWGSEYGESTNDLLWNIIKRLREKLKVESDGFEYIETVREVGYLFPFIDH